MKNPRRRLSFITASTLSTSSFLPTQATKRITSIKRNHFSTSCTLQQTNATSIQPAADPSDFPILSRTVNDKPLVYLDSAATSQKPKCVIDALTSYYSDINSNVHRGAHTLAAKATDEFEQTRTIISKFINASRTEEIIYTRNATEAINLIASTWGRVTLKKDDIIIVSVMEHHANLVPWQMITNETKSKIIPIPLNMNTQTYDINYLKDIINKYGNKIKLIACSHISNVLGCINPINEIIHLAHDNNSLVLLDACQSLPHLSIDVQNLNVDFLVGSAHKMLGPTGVGFLYGKYDILNNLPPFMGGGEMIQDVFLDQSTFANLPHKFEAGTPAIGEVIAFAKAIQYLQDLNMNNVFNHDIQLGHYLYTQLSQFKEVTIYGPPLDFKNSQSDAPRIGLCSFNVDGIHSGDLATMLDLEGVAVRSGHHCAQPLHRELGVASSARASLYVYNTMDDVDKFIEALRESVSLLGGSLTSRHHF